MYNSESFFFFFFPPSDVFLSSHVSPFLGDFFSILSFINAWINTSKAGNKYMKLSFWDKAETAAKGIAEAKKALAPQPQPEGFPEDDIPF